MSQQEQLNAADVIATSDGVRSNKHLPKKTLLMGVGLIAVILLVGLVILIVGMQKPKTPLQTTTTIPPIVNVKHQLTDAQTALKNAKTPQAQATAYYDLGGAYMNNNEGSQAIAAYNNALNIKNSGNPYEYGTLIGLGYAYNMAGQNANAISTFNKLISLLQESNDPTAQSQVSTYQNVVKQLQAGESI